MRMTFRTMTLLLAVSGALFMACGDDSSDDTTPAPSADAAGTDVAATDTATGDTAATDTATTDAPGPAAADFAAVASALKASCGGCHGGAAGCSIASACFLDDEENLTNAPVNGAACGNAESVAECSVARIGNGTMPPGGANAPSAEEVAVLEAYLSDM